MQTYLQKYEYFGPDIGDQVHDDTQLEKAIRALQYQCNLNVTGDVLFDVNVIIFNVKQNPHPLHFLNIEHYFYNTYVRFKYTRNVKIWTCLDLLFVKTTFSLNNLNFGKRFAKGPVQHD